MNAASQGTRAVIFDLDGTIVDPAGSITSGIAKALAAHGIPVPHQAILDAMVGPPLAASLEALPGVQPEQVPSIIAHYREGYLSQGMADSRVYPGVKELLEELRDRGISRAIATSKPEPLAQTLLRIQGVDHLFDAIHGSDIDETVPHVGKAAIVRAALASVGLPEADPSLRSGHAVMVGDRYFDVEGAHANGVPCIGVAWGYAPDGELTAAGADAVVHDAAELGRAIEHLLELDGAHTSGAENQDAVIAAETKEAR